jgi:hypothetical protein
MKKLFIFLFIIFIISLAWGQIDKFWKSIPDFEHKTKVLELLKTNYPSLLEDNNISDSIDFNVILLVALIDQESDFNWRAIGDNGNAKGLFQLHLEAIQQCYIVGFRPSNKDSKYYFSNLEKFPLTQWKFAIEYLSYWYEYGGIDIMIRFWNSNDWYLSDLMEDYQYYYLIWNEISN